MEENKTKTTQEAEQEIKAQETNTEPELESDIKQARKKEALKAQKDKSRIKGRRRLFADYRYEDVTTKKGKKVRRKVYKGKHWAFKIPYEYKKDPKYFLNRVKFFYVGLAAVLIALWLVAGIAVHAQGLGYPSRADIDALNTPLPSSWITPSGSVVASYDAGGLFDPDNIQHFYVLLPYLVCALPLLLILLTMVEFLFTRDRRFEQAFAEALTVNLRWQTIMTMICAGLCAVAELIFLFVNYARIDSVGAEISLASLMGMMVALCVFYLKLQDGIIMEEVK